MTPDFMNSVQFSELRDKYGERLLSEYIHKVQAWERKTGRYYNDFFGTVRKWLEEDSKKTRAEPMPKLAKRNSFNDIPDRNGLDGVDIGQLVTKNHPDVPSAYASAIAFVFAMGGLGLTLEETYEVYKKWEQDGLRGSYGNGYDELPFWKYARGVVNAEKLLQETKEQTERAQG